MRILKTIAIALLCMTYNTYGMEVWGATRIGIKDYAKKLLINEDKQSPYSSLSNPYTSPSNTYHQYGKQNSWLKESGKLPLELKKHIIGNFMKLYFAQQDINIKLYLDNFVSQYLQSQNIDPEAAYKTELVAKIAELESDYLLSRFTLLCRAQKISPLRIGNKEFGWKDVITLTKEQQDELFKIGNPNQCCSFLTGLDNNIFHHNAWYTCNKKDSDVFILTKQPDHITRDMIIKRGFCYEGFMGTICPWLGIMGVMCITIAPIIGCTHPSCCGYCCWNISNEYQLASFIYALGSAHITAASIWAGIARASLCFECCIKQYAVDQDKDL